MKVLHLLTSKIFSGAENVVYQIMTMTKDEKDLSMVYAATDGPVKEELEKREVPFELLPVVNVKNVKELIRHQKPDLIHAHDMKASFIAALACGRIPLVCHIHNNDPLVRKISPKALAFLPAGIKAGHIFWVSQSAYDGYIFRNIFSGKSSVLKNIINTDLIRQKAEDDPKSYPYDILFIGRFEAQKNPQRFVRIVKMVSEKLPQVRAIMLGTGSLSFDTDDHIECPGFLSSPYKLIKDSKVMLMTSDWEGLPMSALEAMALGVPIVTTPVDGMKDVIVHGENGFISSDEKELAEKTLLLIQDTELRSRMSKEQIRKSDSLNNVENYRKEILKAYGC